MDTIDAIRERGVYGCRFGEHPIGKFALVTELVERRAIDILEAKDHWAKPEIRKAYKKLIKVLHPDMNGGDRSQEEQ